jgi:hypothetical protein
MGEIVENQQVIFIEFGDRCFEHEITARDLEFLHEIGGSGEQHALALFDQGHAERRCQMRFAAASHDAVTDGHFVDFDAPGEPGRTRQQPVGSRSPARLSDSSRRPWRRPASRGSRLL